MDQECLYLKGSKEFIVFNIKKCSDDFFRWNVWVLLKAWSLGAEGHSDNPSDFFLNVYHANYASAYRPTPEDTSEDDDGHLLRRQLTSFRCFRRWRPCSLTTSILLQSQSTCYHRSLLVQPGQSHTNCPAWWSMCSSTSFGWQRIPGVQSWCLLDQRDKLMNMSSAAARNDLHYLQCTCNMQGHFLTALCFTYRCV